ncbi:Pam3-gp28 family putative phage holin [Sphingomonas oryzagri]|uniref:Uncharacterized protein n=1 Tax=Sphingomonas oryzagri TaxID=3042314 RepID=A0ABT6N5Y3_9SPHN|nr:hypothetical protein [Sphingomonas oryzagri]MDH7640529.1 hypothetical protein [Sphingomonas oryzagri]
MNDLPSPASTAARAIAAAIVRHVITAAGTALVAHGYVDQDTVNGAVSPIADEVLGALLVAGAASWSAIRARAAHWRWVEALYAPAEPRPPVQPS